MPAATKPPTPSSARFMELDDCGQFSGPRPTEVRSSHLAIDLNEIPSSSADSDPFNVVRSFHDAPEPPPEPAAERVLAPGPTSCLACGEPEERGGGQVVVCDGCERGFHVACAGMLGMMNVEEWVCRECAEKGVKSKRWPLGFKSKRKRFLDMNASPPSDGDCDGEASEDVIELRRRTSGGNSFGGNPFAAPVRCSNSSYIGNGYGLENVVGITRDIQHHQPIRCGSFEVDLSFPVRNLKSSSNSAIRLSSRTPKEILLQALTDYISQRNGVLEEGWYVEFKQSFSGCGVHVVYCAPDGVKFDSMAEVACYLGLVSNDKLAEPRLSSEGSTVQERLHLSRKRKSSRSSAMNGFTGNKGYVAHTHGKEFTSDSQRMEVVSSNVKAGEAGSEEYVRFEFQQHKDGLPVQFEDFFLLNLGSVDLRPSYHESNRIWPVGYRSCWHDKITGSILFCEVLDGGNSGPLFKIRRCSCSVVPIPNGSTILFRGVIPQFAGSFTENSNDGKHSSLDCDDDGIIAMILDDSALPTDSELLSCLHGDLNEAFDETKNSVQIDQSSICDNSATLVTYEDGFRDDIGEIVVEERSSYLAWKKLSQVFVDAFVDIRNRESTFKLACKHVKNETVSSYWDMMDEKCAPDTIAWQKFCSSPVFSGFPWDDNDGDIPVDSLLEWLAQDRFGLDAEFVQETIEQLPGVDGCSNYVPLSNRYNYARLLTVGNGNLIVKRKEGVEIKEGARDGLFGKSRNARVDGDNERCLPSGTVLCSRLPPETVGDCYQAWEVLWRFHDILDLKEPLELKELEDELINPWIDATKLAVNSGQELRECEFLDLNSTDHVDDRAAPSGTAPGSKVCGDDLCEVISTEAGAVKELSHSKNTSVSYSTCCGVALTKVHSLLLRVLIGELLLRVAARVAPTCEAGELKYKRGRRKDMESSLPAKRAKLSMLPINELSWPELARRYILSIIAMHNNSDSADVTTGESSKAFRCLRGDGGVLCGSLTGVAGMEADALLLAEASKQIFGSLSKDNAFLTIEVEDFFGSDASEKTSGRDGNLPDWAQDLVPVRSLPTNVGTRIRKCVYDALAKGPPEWAKKILEHSISKEVYKGNASGPTKKAVLTLLKDLSSEITQQKPDRKSKKRTVFAVSDIIMKQCRIILRKATATDDGRVFCNLLGRKLMNTAEKYEEGTLGSPAMVSRPLDFRTIDLRLAVGTYSGSLEAFLEDVQELWNNVRTAFGDEAGVVELVDKLSQNFESLYGEEVVTIANKLREYAKLDSLHAEMKKEVDDILASHKELPKAPWDEGVCKVCGIDKDDDSVLLCDTCDAEYHTYCLNPPLARIPEGNWYCPSCVVGRNLVQDPSEQSYVIRKHRGRKFQKVMRDYLEALTSLASRIEAVDYWDYSVEERTFLLKILCDELLSSALIRKHLERCAEISAELQQKLRYFVVEWKNLKLREDYIAARAVKTDDAIKTTGEVLMKGGLEPAQSANGRCIVHEQSNRSNCLGAVSDLQSVELSQEKLGLNGFEHSSITASEKIDVCNGKASNPYDAKGPLEDSDVANSNRELPSAPLSRKLSDPPFSDPFPEETNDSGRKDYKPEFCLHSDGRSFSCAQDLDDLNESQTHHVELTSVKNEITALQESISNLESQLVKLSLRREFLGSDSAGRLYWAAAIPGQRPRVVVDGTLVSQQRMKVSDFVDPERRWCRDSASSALGQSSQGSKAQCPFVHELKGTSLIDQTWVSYETDAEIEQLVGWLKDDDLKERALKDAIMHLQRFKFQDRHFPGLNTCDASETEFEGRSNSENIVISDPLATKAAAFMEKKYGPAESESASLLRKRGKRGKVPNEEKLYRCECLELIWSSRQHCLICHKTFLTDVEQEVHNDGRCSSGLSSCAKGRENADSSTDKGILKSDSAQKEEAREVDGVAGLGSFDLSSKLIKFQNEGPVCPYDINDISSKFVTKDSIKDLVQQVGLIGSNGIPSLVSSRPPYLDDSDLMPILSIDASVATEEDMEVGTSARGNQSVFNTIRYESSNTRPGSENIGTQRGAKLSLGCSEERGRKHFFDYHAAATGVGRCCVVPQSALRPLVGRVSPILRQLKINLLDMDAALDEGALKPSRAHLERRWAWRSFVKSSKTIYQMVQATIVLEDMIKSEYLRKEWWYWSSLSAAVKTSTLSSLALRIYSLDSAILYENMLPDLDSTDSVVDQPLQFTSGPMEISKASRKSSRKRREPEG